MADQESAPTKSLGKVLVIGGCGFLGSHLVDQLLNFPSETSSEKITATSHSKSNDKHNSPSSRLQTAQDASQWQFASLRSQYPSFTNTSVHVLDLRCTHNRFEGAIYHEADLTSPQAILEVFKTVKPDIVINTASPQYTAPREVLRKVNVEGTQNLLDVAGGKLGSWGGTCKAFVHTSSSSVIHDNISPLINADETYPYVEDNPREYYATTKVQAEKLVLAANRSAAYNNLLTSAIRPASIVGERDRGGIGPGYLETARIAPTWQLHFQMGAGNSLWDSTYAGNVAYALILVAERLAATFERQSQGLAMPLEHERVDGEAFIVTNDSPLYMWDLARFYWTGYGREVNLSKVVTLPETLTYWIGFLGEIISKFTGRPGKLTRQNIKYMTVPRYYSCEKLKARCGYVPLVELEEGIRREIREYVREHNNEQQDGVSSVEKKAQ